MESHPCPKCNEPMDEGRMIYSGSDYAAYVSNKQKGMLRTAAKIVNAHACPNCGYVEMYLYPQELKQRIG